MINLNLRSEEVKLTKSEVAILYEVMQGLNNKDIAKHLNITTHTVKFHLQNLLSKTYTHSRTELCTKIFFLLLGRPLSPEMLFESLA